MDFLKIPFAKSTREFLTKHQNIVFLNDDDTLYFRGYSDKKWGNLGISLAQTSDLQDDKPIPFLVVEVNDEQKVAIPFTPTLMGYLQASMVNWLEDGDNDEIARIFEQFG